MSHRCSWLCSRLYRVIQYYIKPGQPVGLSHGFKNVWVCFVGLVFFFAQTFHGLIDTKKIKTLKCFSCHHSSWALLAVILVVPPDRHTTAVTAWNWVVQEADLGSRTAKRQENCPQSLPESDPTSQWILAGEEKWKLGM